MPGKDAKATEWHCIAAETEPYRNRYNIGGQETALIPKQYRNDPTAQRLIERSTALHKHSEFITVTPRTATQTQQGADEAVTRPPRRGLYFPAARAESFQVPPPSVR